MHIGLNVFNSAMGLHFKSTAFELGIYVVVIYP
jgi:hypothetical protein